jgi:predicted nucleic acid-binding protein
MIAVFADSFHFLALLNRDDPAHERAVVAQNARPRLVLTDCVILELGDALCDPRDHEDFWELSRRLSADPHVKIVRLTPSLLKRGIQRMHARRDKNWPLTDCISFIVMEDEGIEEALTGDRHFEQAGFVALLR